MFDTNIEFAMFMHGHSLSSNNPKHCSIFLTATMVGEVMSQWSIIQKECYVPPNKDKNFLSVKLPLQKNWGLTILILQSYMKKLVC